MITVDHVYPGMLTNIVGPAGTIRRILKSHDFIKEYNLDVYVFNKGKLLSGWKDDIFLSFKPNEKSLKHRVRQKLDTYARNSIILSSFLMTYVYFTTRKFVESYLALNRHPDCVVFHSEIEAYYYLKLCKQPAKSIVFYHSDGLPLEMFYNYYPKLRGSWLAKILMKKFDFVINKTDKCAFICKKGKDNLTSLYPSISDKSYLVVNGIDDLTKHQLEDIKRIKKSREDCNVKLVCVGSVSIRKGQRLLIEALGMMSKEDIANYYVTIVGEGPDKEYCMSLVSQYDIADRVEFVGAVPNNEVYKYLAQSDIFVLMSKNEGLPISIIEAMRAGLAILSTNVSGIPELLTNNNGLLIDVNSVSLAEVLKNGASVDWKGMGLRSRELFEKQFTFDRMRKDYMDMIKSLF